MDKRAVDKLIKETYPELPPKLQQAARYVIDHPKAVALNSMRAVALDAGLPSSAMNRFAVQLGFDGYEPLRDVYRRWLAQGPGMFTERASALQQHDIQASASGLIQEIVEADCNNLAGIREPATTQSLNAACDLLVIARHVYVAGLRSLFPAAYYFNYACNMFRDNTRLLSGVAGVFADDLRHAKAGDTLIVFSYHPYAKDAISAVKFAREHGLKIIAVTDSAVSPVARHATVTILVSTTTPSIFPSVVPALSIAQTLVAMLIARAGRQSLKEIEKSEAQLQEFAVYAKDSKKAVR
ncbi:MurR/RpiR family transcriptional regulator [Orrella marina]|uniref:MurR/RpiR family transcriptional regulator n=1 Tax=Orrella marina TaxID=2163011 RepID=A0A2R4XLY0_9BURK|nr:MurR/RpiR family transcriptional regulator [Orrella marina]AWB34771.1 MurR/RpiR family transcriptional regulator [Orrella marina]